MVFGNGIKNIQAAAYNGARTVYREGPRKAPPNLQHYLYFRTILELMTYSGIYRSSTYSNTYD